MREPWLEAAQDDATLIAIHDMERAGIDIITDGEIRRESYSNRFATALSGVDLDNPATVRGRSSGTVVVPRIVGDPLARSVEVAYQVPRQHQTYDRDPPPAHSQVAPAERILPGRGRAGDGLRRRG